METWGDWEPLLVTRLPVIPLPVVPPLVWWVFMESSDGGRWLCWEVEALVKAPEGTMDLLPSENDAFCSRILMEVSSEGGMDAKLISWSS